MVLGLMLPAQASAGTFTVTGTNGLWTPYNNRPGRIAVYPEGYALITRNVHGRFSTPSGSQGGWVFDAPPGASIASFTVQGPFLGWDGWQAAVLAAGEFPVENCPGQDCPGGEKYLLGNVVYHAYGASAVMVRLRCSSTRGCTNQGWHGYANIYSATVTIADFTPPGVRATGGPLVAGGWRRAAETVFYDAGDNVGIKEVRAYLDGSPRAAAPRACFYGSKIPCPNGAGALTVDTSGVPDGAHRLTIQAIDAADNVGEATQIIATDNSAPASPAEPSLRGDPGWRATNQFEISWSNPPQSGGPVTMAVFQLCPEANAPTDPRGCTTGTRSATNITRITNLQVPREGSWTLRLWLRDAAGNDAPSSAIVVRPLRFDATPPSVRFLPSDPNDPTRVRVAASDAVSGIAVGTLEIRRRGSDLWRTIPVAPEQGGFSGIVDDGILPAGRYDVRARAVDAAGNERSTDRAADGSSMSLALPLRIRTHLAVGQVKRTRAHGRRHRGRRRLLGVVRARYSERVTLHGRLTTPGGNPLEGSDLDVWQRVGLPGASWARIGTVRTSRTGRFAFRAGRGPNRSLQFRYPGTPTIRSRTSTVDIRVAASSSIHVRPRRVLNGDYVTFRGRVRGRPLPAGGKLVELQVFTRRRWRTFAQPRANHRTGLWRYAYRFEAVTGRVTFRFRARIRKETDFPFELGRSRQVDVTVQGL
jgi:hypothetical protein